MQMSITALKNVKGWRLLNLFTMVAFCLTMGPAQPAMAQQLVIPMGTSIIVVTVVELSSENSQAGDAVYLAVPNDVVINGTTVISAGATVLAEVSMVQKSSMIGIPGKLSISIKSVQAVDGTTIILSGNKTVVGNDSTTKSIILTLFCLFGLLIHGGPATIPAGTHIQANVAATAQLNI